MRYRQLGKTGVAVSEIGFGGEWLERHTREEGVALIRHCAELGVNILDCWMSDPNVRSTIGEAIRGSREKWHIQGHIGSTWQDGQYVRTRDLEKTRAAFADLLERLGTDYIDFGMIHYVDSPDEMREILDGEFYAYVKDLRDRGIIKHIGLSTHNPETGIMAAKSGKVEMILFSVNPAFDMMPPSDDILDRCFGDDFGDDALGGIEPTRAEFYRVCEQNGIGITVMKGYAGGRLFDAQRSPFGVALTPTQCLHYALTRPAVSAVMVGCDTPEQADEAAAYELATDAEKDYASVLAKAPRHAFAGQCTYCGHCAPCPMKLDIAMVNKYADLAKMQPEVPQSVREHYLALSAHASDCIGCGGCESRCPFGVPVVERMRETAEIFGK